ncbi:GerAB/ArcD/ProY family transporter [Siminovitchia sediminis]|uniref:GerAB/ArcD/ProY family transporter n=1 Tax=Siminovitchia sediminis TaxID=1274353 RepID=A0ABW4KJS9_9BACI
MNRFIFYCILVNMIANMISAVSKILMDHKKDGIFLSMLLAVLSGMVIVYVFGKFFSKFPGKDLQTLLEEYTPVWVSKPVLFLTVLHWFISGVLSIVSYTFMLKRFLTPEMPITWIATTILIIISYGILMNTKSVLYTIENILLFSLPIVLYLVFKAYTNRLFEWDFVREAFMYVNTLPTYSSYAAAMFIFLGITNIVVFNPVFKDPIKMTWKHTLFTGFLGSLVLLTLYLVPIGMNGFERVDHLVYPAISTSDTLRMTFGIIERVLYLFLPLFLAISILNLLLHWHVAIEACKSLFFPKWLKWRNTNYTPHLYIAVFWVITLITIKSLSEYSLLQYSKYFYNLIPLSSLFYFFIFWLIRRRAKT